jgi:PAS domain S-box-containing protein
MSTKSNLTLSELFDQRSLLEIIDSLHNGMVVVDADCRIIAFNRAASRIFGVEKSTAFKKIQDVLPNSQLPSVLASGEARKGVKTRLGASMVISNITPVIMDGKIVGAISVFQDISELEALVLQAKSGKELAAELNAIFESSYDGIYVTDSNGDTLRVNSAYQRITGLSLKQLMGKNIKDIVKQGLISESITFKVLEQKKTITIKQTISTGKKILVTGNPIFNEQGEIIRVVTNVRDMTELNNLHKKLERSMELQAHYEQEISQLKNKYEGQKKIIVKSRQMQNTIDMAERLARVDTTVLILGESGVGKELIAQLIHENSSRPLSGAFIKVNCGAIPGDLLESELFGYEEGAFTGARKGGKAGLFEIADGGTIFLDEIAELPLNLQVKLLRVLQEKEMTRIGGSKPIMSDVRIISATNKDLYNMVKSKLFREDLYYRLNVVPLLIPPLRERTEDILPLTIYHLEYFSKKHNITKIISPKTMECLMAYSWPGNIRELINTLERMVVTVDHDILEPQDLPQTLLSEIPELHANNSLLDAVASLEKKLISKALMEHKTTRKAAIILGISQTCLIKKAKKYGILFQNQWSVK